MNTAQIFRNLTPQDRTLLHAAIAKRFDLHALIDPASPHPAQHDLLDLLIWFDETHIRAAADAYVRIISRADAYAITLDAPSHAAALKQLLACNLELLDRSEYPVDPTDQAANDKAISRNRHIAREARLLLNTISRFCALTTTAAPRTTSPRSRSKPTPRTADNASAAASQHTDSSTAPNQAVHRTNPPQPFPDPDLQVTLNTQLNHLNALLAPPQRGSLTGLSSPASHHGLDNAQSTLLSSTS
jgi:hypothetical protein